MVPFLKSTMIGQVTPIGMTNSGWKFYILFVVSTHYCRLYYTVRNLHWGLTSHVQVCNFTNAVFFWAMLPETKQLPLEEMKKLFTDTPWFVGNISKSEYPVTEASVLAQQIEHKGLQDKGGTATHDEIITGNAV